MDVSRRVGGVLSRARALPPYLWLAVAAPSLSACSSEDVLGDYPAITCDLAEPPADPEGASLVVASFWTADDNENTALNALLKPIPPGYSAGPLRRLTRVDAQRRLSAAFENNQLPDVFQVNGGSDVLRWVDGRTPESADVCALDRLRDAYGWEKAYFRDALEPLKCDGHLFGLPIGIHKLNTLFYNVPLFERLKARALELNVSLRDPSELGTPQELADELEVIEQVRATWSDGDAFTPFAFGGKSKWPLTVVAFENVLLGLGRDAYEALWMGGLADAGKRRRDAVAARIDEMVAVLQRLVEHAHLEDPLTWQEAMVRVGEGEALFTVTGDWGWAQLNEAEAADVRTVSFPGTKGSFVYTPDSFAVPRELGKSGFAPHYFLHEVVENEETLFDFSNKKHSIPARLLPDDESGIGRLGTALQDTYRHFDACTRGEDGCQLLLAVSGLAPAPGIDPCFDDIDTLLAVAVTKKLPPPDDDEDTRVPCDVGVPADPELARALLRERLLETGKQRFAAACR